MADSKYIHLTVQTLSGSFDSDFDVDQKLQEVIDKAFLSLDIKPTPGETWEVQYENARLDPHTTIAHNKIPDGATLMLAPKEGGGGCQQTTTAGRDG